MEIVKVLPIVLLLSRAAYAVSMNEIPLMDDLKINGTLYLPNNDNYLIKNSVKINEKATLEKIQINQELKEILREKILLF